MALELRRLSVRCGLAPLPSHLHRDFEPLAVAHDDDGDGAAGHGLVDAQTQVARRAHGLAAEVGDEVALLQSREVCGAVAVNAVELDPVDVRARHAHAVARVDAEDASASAASEEHTSELQSQSKLGCQPRLVKKQATDS